MEAVADFAVALTEVDALVAVSRACGHGSPNRPILMKASLLLLAAKLECFFENVVEEYCDELGTLESASLLPEAVRVHASRKILLDSRMHENDGVSAATALEVFGAIAHLWTGRRPCPKVLVDNKFAYGKHGEKQVEKLFRRIGIDSVFSAFPIVDDFESMAMSQGPISLAADFNSLCSLRNNIIHTDASPAILTEEEIERYKRRFLRFSELLGESLKLSLRDLRSAHQYEI